jgi:hypothetical protein
MIGRPLLSSLVVLVLTHRFLSFTIRFGNPRAPEKNKAGLNK